ncbi:MAG: prenyltransferase/squalene oxidase repeat-containing protein, partial [Desulfobacula sp.]
MIEINNGHTWLLNNQNPSGSYGDKDLTEFRDTTAVADILKKFSATGAAYSNAISFIERYSPPSTDFLARKTSVLAQDGTDVSLLIDQLLSSQNPDQIDSTRYNYPEGGWGATIGYSTNCLDTALVLDTLNQSPIPKGLLIINKTIAAGETQEFNFDYPVDTSDLSIFLSKISGNVTFRLYPDPSSTYYSWGPLTSSTYLNAGGITITPGTRRVQIYGNASSTYSLKITLTSGGYNSAALINPLAYILTAQNSDGGWGLGKGSDSSIYMTAKVLMTLQAYANTFDFSSVISKGVVWLKSRQNPDKGFGAEGSSVHETAMAYIAIATGNISAPEAQGALSYLLTAQQSDGSWNGKVYDTAISLLALYTSMLETDTDGDGVPDILDNCPGVANADQKNADGDNLGDACDNDDDNDGLPDTYEINSTGTNPLMADSDNDGI